MIKVNNGAVPVTNKFILNNYDYVITRFLGILKDHHVEDGIYDIGVVLTMLEERLTSNEDLIGADLLPIAELFAGDYLCLDFRKSRIEPSVCVWYHEESGDFDPVTKKVADSFNEFLGMLME